METRKKIITMDAIKNYIAKFSKRHLIILITILVLAAVILVAVPFVLQFKKGTGDKNEPFKQSQKVKMREELKELEGLRAKALDNGTSSQEEMNQDLVNIGQQRKEADTSASSQEEMQKQLEELNKLREQ